MNEQLLRRIQSQIKAHPKNFDMGTFGEDHACGTVCCIAGWALFLNGENPSGMYFEEVENRARRLLDLKARESDRLFYEDEWPSEFLKSRLTKVGEASQAVRRIDHFIKTEGKE